MAQDQKYGAPRENVITRMFAILANDYTVAATDLFPFANQCPRQEIRSLTNQSTGRAH